MNPSWSLGILAGGRSVRMGRDKADLSVAGKTLLEHVVARLSAPGVPVIVATRPDGPGAHTSHDICFDSVADAGPLAGIAALLGAARTSHVLVVPCDQPLLPPTLGEVMLREAAAADASAVIFRHGAHEEPFPALLAADGAATIHSLLDGGKRRALAWRESLTTRVLSWDAVFPGHDETAAFMSVNEPGALATFERRLRAGE